MRKKHKTGERNSGPTLDPLTFSIDKCSACEARMDGTVAGLCGRCPPEALRAFIDRVYGRKTEAAAEVQLEFTQ